MSEGSAARGPGGDAPVRRRRGILFVLSSPSGAGKSTLTRRLLDTDPDFELSISATTRARRAGEIEGKHYFFVSRPEFERMVAQDEMLEHAEVFDNRYGTPRAPVENAIRSGRDVLFDVDWQGAQQLRASDLGQSVVQVFILPPSIAELERRLRARAQDSEAVIARRMAKARDEISHWAEYPYVLVNDDMDRCFEQMTTIIAAERLRWERQSWVFPKVNALYEEFGRRHGQDNGGCR
ncbi:guanylate kinase [Paralimibaculum aggregatum]|uniref:guanylate kinase n=1 Tax=Paralimibaculum aggregatum TaxID=3036245 RepID=UPI003DA1464B